MKVQIRTGVFETNSSSMHSLTYKPNGEPKFTHLAFPLNRIDGEDALEVTVTLGEYGWEWNSYHEPEEKIRYILTHCIVLCDSEVWHNTEKYFKTDPLEGKNINDKWKVSNKVILDLVNDFVNGKKNFKGQVWDELKEITDFIKQYSGVDNMPVKRIVIKFSPDTSWYFYGIDHQSVYDSLEILLRVNGVKSLKTFIFDPSCSVDTGNDNESDPSED